MANLKSDQSEGQSTLSYYNNNAGQFVSGTVDVEFQETQERFLKYLDRGSRILDLGCGSGRDTKYFLDRGYQAAATDGSEELCRIASDYTGIPVACRLFQELDEIQEYHGIWACSSILHLNRAELADVMGKIRIALRPGGVLYTSFKYGESEGLRGGRYFTDMTEKTLETLLVEVPGYEVRELWVTPDVRPGRETEFWLNVILQRVDAGDGVRDAGDGVPQTGHREGEVHHETF